MAKMFSIRWIVWVALSGRRGFGSSRAEGATVQVEVAMFWAAQGPLAMRHGPHG